MLTQTHSQGTRSTPLGGPSPLFILHSSPTLDLIIHARKSPVAWEALRMICLIYYVMAFSDCI